MMQARAKRSVYIVLGICAFAAVSGLAFVGYLTPEMAIYFLSFKWCF
ncbi:MAG TPA: hypothetical protein VM051_14850 [Usitatibacter sp.]|nr:hypothetical protein [Usitatibacter sp.]